MTLQSTALARVAVGLMQGIALYLLQQALESKAWPATDGLIFAPLLMVAMFVPIIVVVGLGNMRLGTLAAWTAVATAVCAGLAMYNVFRDPTGGAAILRVGPTPTVWLCLAAGLFITHSLIASSDADRKFIASYSRYFDVSWKQGVQLVLAVCFVALFWAMLWLGAELFRLIKIEFLADLIKRRWFWIPVTALAFTYALHITDVRAGLVRGTRTLTLSLLSWLLPIMTLITVAFLLALLFTGLEPLWSTRRATAILLAAAGALIFLINDAYQDGDLQDTVAGIVRHSGTVAALALVPVVVLAAYALALRVGQYGWTPDRIIALACVAVAGCYALGYVLAAVRRGTWLESIELTNVATAYIILAVLLALLTPIADPARLSVADQVARLESGKVSPDQFDFAFLRFLSGRYGEQALERLKTKQDGPDAVRISQKANEALDWRTRAQAQPSIMRATPQSRAANITVLNSSAALPDSFVQQNWGSTPRPYLLPRCLTADAKCEAILVDLDGDGTAEILLFTTPTGAAAAFQSTADGKWAFLGPLANAHCAGVRDALRAGKFEMVAALFKEIEVSGQRVRVVNSDCAPANR
jgi:Domain of unknown function (DUF4153)